jgi:hypothetical protein
MFPEVTHPLINPHGPIGRRIVARTRSTHDVTRVLACTFCGTRHEDGHMTPRVWRTR